MQSFYGVPHISTNLMHLFRDLSEQLKSDYVPRTILRLRAKSNQTYMIGQIYECAYADEGSF